MKRIVRNARIQKLWLQSVEDFKLRFSSRTVRQSNNRKRLKTTTDAHLRRLSVNENSLRRHQSSNANIKNKQSAHNANITTAIRQVHSWWWTHPTGVLWRERSMTACTSSPLQCSTSANSPVAKAATDYLNWDTNALIAVCMACGKVYRADFSCEDATCTLAKGYVWITYCRRSDFVSSSRIRRRAHRTVRLYITFFRRLSLAVTLSSRVLMETARLLTSLRQLVSSFCNAALRYTYVTRIFFKRANSAVNELAQTWKPSKANGIISSRVPGTVIPELLHFTPKASRASFVPRDDLGAGPTISSIPEHNQVIV